MTDVQKTNTYTIKRKKMATIHLNKEEFLKRIWDFEKSPKELHFR